MWKGAETESARGYGNMLSWGKGGRPQGKRPQGLVDVAAPGYVDRAVRFKVKVRDGRALVDTEPSGHGGLAGNNLKDAKQEVWTSGPYRSQDSGRLNDIGSMTAGVESLRIPRKSVCTCREEKGKATPIHKNSNLSTDWALSSETPAWCVIGCTLSKLGCVAYC